jgi:hypothetical protein
MDELTCKYVGSFGLLKSCDRKSPTPVSDFAGLNSDWYANAKDNELFHVCPQALPKFVDEVLPNLTKPFILLTNNSDMTIPSDLTCSLTLLDHPLLKHWYAQNCVSDHQKLTRIPIGLDYHSLKPSGNKFAWSQPERHSWGIKKMPKLQEEELFAIKSSAHERTCRAYANFQFLMTTRYGKVDRVEAFNTVPKELVFYEPFKTTRDVCWKNMIKYTFVLSPQGNGIDCHRTWEALCLGCYPIVKTSGLDPLFDELPVWIVKEWTDVTAENMKQKESEFKLKEFKLEKLTLKYWQELIYSTWV